MNPAAILRTYIAFACIAIFAISARGAEHGLVARYHLDEGSGDRIADASGNHLDGKLVGGATWTDGIHGKALSFDGTGRASIADSPRLNLSGPVTLTAWVRGHGGKYRMVKLPSTYQSLRGPYFNVCGDTIYFASNSDHASHENPELSKDDTLKKHPDFPWNDWHLWTGRLDINLTGYTDVQRTHYPLTGLEPKMQVVGSRIYYEYFGQDASRAWQIYTAQSNLDGSDWHAVQRTQEKDGYRVEQEGNLRVVGNRVYDGWPEKDAHDEWQLWTSISNLDGSSFHAVQRTTGSGWIPNIQVVGNKVFYMYPTFKDWSKRPAPEAFHDKLVFATTDANGDNWKIIREIPDLSYVPSGWASFEVHNGRIYFAYSQLSGIRGGYLFTGSMNADGSDFQTKQRTFGDDLAGPPHNSIQVVGKKVYYTFGVIHSGKSVVDFMRSYDNNDWLTNKGKTGFQLWTAEANLDGSGWKATQRSSSPPDLNPGYRSLEIVGAKSYVGITEDAPYPGDRMRTHAYIATFGGNLISKGGAFGLGLTEKNDARGFINAGLDHLVRGEAPADTAGAIADAAIDKQWHFVAATYERNSLKLYVDGELRSTTSYKGSIGSSPFPLILGDGLEGVLDEVAIYNRAFSAEEVHQAYRAERGQTSGR